MLCLVAAGATNCAIATRLFISPKTASVHVSHILAKLGGGDAHRGRGVRARRRVGAALGGPSGPWGTASGWGERQLVGA